MLIFLSIGHSRLKNGSYTSATGCCNEYKYNKKLVKDVKKELIKKGHKVDVVICPEKVFEKAENERPYKLAKERSKNYDLVIELHLNAGGGQGAEVWYKSDNGKKYANLVQNGLVKIFKNRGVKKAVNLYMLNQTKAPAIIVESFFCDSKSDYNKAKGTVKRKKVAKAICKYL